MTRKAFFNHVDAQNEANQLALEINGEVKSSSDDTVKFDTPDEIESWSGEIDTYEVYDANFQRVASFAYWN